MVELPPGERGESGEERGTAATDCEAVTAINWSAMKIQRDMSKRSSLYQVQVRTCKILDVKLLVFRRLSHRARFILLKR